MGFLKTNYINTSNVPVPYWNILDYKLNKHYKTVEATFAGWYNQETSLNPNTNYIEVKRVKCYQDKFDNYFSINIENEVNNNTFHQIYLFAKENESFFSDAKDILENTI